MFNKIIAFPSLTPSIKLLLVLTILIVGFFISSVATQAQPVTPLFSSSFTLSGYAWSSTIGWVSMSCSNTGTCGTSDYKVTVQPDGRLTGYAWSSNIGWIQFGGLGTSFPSGSGSVDSNARMVNDGSGYKLEGWVRACAGTSPGGDCSSTGSRTDGWDGWISLVGTANNGSPYGISLNADLDVTPTSFAWGSDVVGWMAWGPLDESPGVIFNSPPSIDIFSVTPNEVTLNNPTPTNQVTVTWSTSGVDSCVASKINSDGNSDSNWNGLLDSNSDSVSFIPVRGVTEYRIMCSKTGYPDISDVETVTALPDIRIEAFSLDSVVTHPVTGLSVVSYLASINLDGIDPSVLIPYSITFNGETQTGDLPGGSLPVRFEFSDVNYSTPLSPALLEIDLDDPPDGVVLENLPSTPVDEDITGNSLSAGAPTLVAPPVNVLLFAAEPSTIRYNTATAIRWELSAPYEANCTINGPGVTETVELRGGSPGNPNTPVTGAVATSLLTNAALYTLSCTAIDPLSLGLDAGAPRTITVQVTGDGGEI